MLKTGNSKADTCLHNLFCMVEGEVQIDQCRGLRADITDMPATTAYALLQASAYWVSAHYEPRVNFAGVPIGIDGKLESNYTLTAQIQQ